MIRLLALICFWGISYTIFGQQTWSFQDQDFTYTLSVDSILCGSINDNYCSTVKSITICSNQNNEIIQTLIPEQYLFNGKDTSLLFIIEDMNFDGYNDIRLLNWRSTNLQTSYWYWFYNKSSRQFQKDTMLEKFSNPYFDRSKKTFHTWWRIGFESFGHALYKWDNTQFVLIIEEEESWSVTTKKCSYLITKKNVDGEIIETFKLIKKGRLKYLHNNCVYTK